MSRVGANGSKKREQRIEKVTKLKLGRIFLIIFVLSALVIFAKKEIEKIDLMAKIAPAITIDSLEIKGCVALDPNVLKDYVALDSSVTILSSKREEIRDELELFAGVKSVKLGSPFSKVLTLTVFEREPIAFAIIDGSIKFVDSEGYLWPFTSGKYWEIPVITGVSDSVDERGIEILKSRDLSRFNKIYNSLENERVIKPIRFDFANRDKIVIQFNGLDYLVKFSNDPGNRITNMWGVIKRFQIDSVDVHHYIDLSYKNVAFYR